MNSFLSKLVYSANEFLAKRKTFEYLEKLEESQWYSPDQIRELQRTKLTKLLRHAYDNVPYYKKVFDGLDLTPHDIKDLDDLAKLPILTKSDVRANLSDMIAKGYEREMNRASTSGSTGHPLILYRCKMREGYTLAARMRARRWWDVDIGDREVMLWGSIVELSNEHRAKRFRDRFLMNCVLLSAFDMTEESMKQYVQVLREFRPKSIYGYAVALYIFSRFINRNQIDVKSIGLKGIFSTAEVLYDHQRANIEATFGCRVGIEYGARDAGFIAHECPEGGIHITADSLYVEFLHGNEPVTPGEEGEIVVTQLDSYGMPFIRYRTGDVGRRSDKLCECGRGLTLMDVIQGRTNNLVVTEEGKIIHAAFFYYIIRDHEGIEQWNLTQRSEKDILIQLVTNSNFDKENLKYIEDKIHRSMGPNTKVWFELVDDIPPGKSGKHQHVISEIADRYFHEREEQMHA